jgi:AAT family amino acid transporter
MIWLINIFLINSWFMDGWPGWKAVPKTAAEIKELESEVVASDVKWTPKFACGLIAGLAGGVGVYFIIINFIPWFSKVYTIIH